MSKCQPAFPQDINAVTFGLNFSDSFKFRQYIFGVGGLELNGGQDHLAGLTAEQTYDVVPFSCKSNPPLEPGQCRIVANPCCPGLLQIEVQPILKVMTGTRTVTPIVGSGTPPATGTMTLGIYFGLGLFESCQCGYSVSGGSSTHGFADDGGCSALDGDGLKGRVAFQMLWQGDSTTDPDSQFCFAFPQEQTRILKTGTETLCSRAPTLASLPPLPISTPARLKGHTFSDQFTWGPGTEDETEGGTIPGFTYEWEGQITRSLSFS